MEFEILASRDILPPQYLTCHISQGITKEQVHIETTFMLDFGRDVLIDVDVEQVSFHLEKDWKIARIGQEKKASLEIESNA